MAVSGTVPKFDYSTATDPHGNTVALVTGAAAGPGLVSGGTVFASEPLNTAFRRLVVQLSGVSGAENVQRELALRAADLEAPAQSNAKRLAIANAILLNQEAQ